MGRVRKKYSESLKPGTRVARWVIVGETELEQRSDGKRARYRVLCECACGKASYVLCTKLLAGQSTRCRSCARKKDWRRRKSNPTKTKTLKEKTNT
jgi:hypothetical protein